MCSPGVTMDLEPEMARSSSSSISTSESNSSFASRRGGSGALGGRMEIGILTVRLRMALYDGQTMATEIANVAGLRCLFG